MLLCVAVRRLIGEMFPVCFKTFCGFFCSFLGCVFERSVSLQFGFCAGCDLLSCICLSVDSRPPLDCNAALLLPAFAWFGDLCYRVVEANLPPFVVPVCGGRPRTANKFRKSALEARRTHSSSSGRAPSLRHFLPVRLLAGKFRPFDAKL